MQLCTTYLLACIQVMKLACASRAAGVEERAKIPYYVMDFFFYADACCETDTQSPIPSLGFSFSSLSLPRSQLSRGWSGRGMALPKCHMEARHCADLSGRLGS